MVNYKFTKVKTEQSFSVNDAKNALKTVGISEDVYTCEEVQSGTVSGTTGRAVDLPIAFIHSIKQWLYLSMCSGNNTDELHGTCNAMYLQLDDVCLSQIFWHLRTLLTLTFDGQMQQWTLGTEPVSVSQVGFQCLIELHHDNIVQLWEAEEQVQRALEQYTEHI